MTYFVIKFNLLGPIEIQYEAQQSKHIVMVRKLPGTFVHVLKHLWQLETHTALHELI